MPAAMSVIVKSISPAVIKLIDEPKRQRSNYLHRQRRNEVDTVYVIGNTRANHIRYSINDNNPYRRNDQISRIQVANVLS